MNINKCFYTGRIGADIDLKTTPSGVSVCTFPLAVDRAKQKDTEKAETDWLDMVAWRGTAEFCSRYLSKGRKVTIECICRTRAWEDKDGKKRKAVEFHIQSIEPADSKPQNDNQTATKPPQYTADAPDFTEIGSDDDLPF